MEKKEEYINEECGECKEEKVEVTTYILQLVKLQSPEGGSICSL